MPRKSLIRTKEFPYHVTARCNNREVFPCTLDEAWKYLTSELYIQHILHEIKIHVFVLMPNHLHILMSTPKENLDTVMKGFMESTTRIINTRTKRSGHLYTGRYYWNLIQSPLYYSHAYKYVLRNPVRAGLCSQVEDYKFSTISTMFGLHAASIPIFTASEYMNEFLPNDFWEMKNWLNTPFLKEEAEALKKAFRKKIFELPLSQTRRKILTLENSNAAATQKVAGH